MTARDHDTWKGEDASPTAKNKRVVLYIPPAQEKLLDDIGEMLGLATPASIVRHLMALGLTALRPQVASWRQSQSVDDMVKLMERGVEAEAVRNGAHVPPSPVPAPVAPGRSLKNETAPRRRGRPRKAR